MGACARLPSHRCEEAQIYYFSRPLPGEQFARLLEAGLPRALLEHFDDALSGVHPLAGGVAGASAAQPKRISV